MSIKTMRTNIKEGKCLLYGNGCRGLEFHLFSSGEASPTFGHANANLSVFTFYILALARFVLETDDPSGQTWAMKR